MEVLANNNNNNDSKDTGRWMLKVRHSSTGQTVFLSIFPGMDENTLSAAVQSAFGLTRPQVGLWHTPTRVFISVKDILLFDSIDDRRMNDIFSVDLPTKMEEKLIGLFEKLIGLFWDIILTLFGNLIVFVILILAFNPQIRDAIDYRGA